MAGFKLSKTQGAGDYTGKEQTFTFLAADANQMALGDAVIVSGTANADGVASITRAAGTAGSEVTGVISSFEIDRSNLELKGRTASTARITKIQVDTNAIYEIEIGSALAITDVSSNLLFTANVPSTSGNSVKSAMVSGVVSATGPLRLIRLIPPTDGTVLGAVGNLAEVTVIRSQLTNLTGV